MNRKTTVLSAKDELLLDLTLHNLPASMLSEFTQKIVKTYYRGSLNAAIQDLMQKALAEEDTVLSHITNIRQRVEA